MNSYSAIRTFTTSRPGNFSSQIYSSYSLIFSLKLFILKLHVIKYVINSIMHDLSQVGSW